MQYFVFGSYPIPKHYSANWSILYCLELGAKILIHTDHLIISTCISLLDYMPDILSQSVLTKKLSMVILWKYTIKWYFGMIFYWKGNQKSNISNHFRLTWSLAEKFIKIFECKKIMKKYSCWKPLFIFSRFNSGLLAELSYEGLLTLNEYITLWVVELKYSIYSNWLDYMNHNKWYKWSLKPHSPMIKFGKGILQETFIKSVVGGDT